VRRFADHFWKTDWPGSSRPKGPSRCRAGVPAERRWLVAPRYRGARARAERNWPGIRPG
jgi:hypothetical protein